jgi:hypothetical protein
MASDPVKALRNLLDALDRYGLADHPWMAEVMSEARAAIAPAPPPETREARCGREETDGGGVCDMRAGHKGRCGTRISPQGHRRWFAASAPPSPAPSPDDEETNRE